MVHWHAHFAHSPTSVAMFTHVLSGRPFSFFAHAKDIYTQSPAQIREKVALADFVVTCTDYNRETLEHMARGLTTPIHRVYHGIDLDLFHPGARDPEARPPYQVLTVARLVPKKGLPTVFSAIKQLRDQGLDIRHTLIGDGDERGRIEALIKNLGLAETTQWIGTLPHEEVIGHYARSDLFVLGCEIAANGDRDGIPNVLTEAMAMGVPVAATRVSAIPELVEHEKTGLLAPPKDSGALASAMARLLTDNALRRKVIPAAMGRVRKHFDNKVLIQDLAGIYASSGTGPTPGGA